jgi:hypothetical protein
MKYVERLLRNEHGNVTIFALSIFFLLMLILFMALFNFSTVFVVKEQASNSAQQAALAATKVVYDQIEEAIREYDRSLSRLLDPVLIGLLVDEKEASLRAAHPDWAESEIRYAAIDQVLIHELPGNAELQGYVAQGLADARDEIDDVVATIIAENHATLEGSTIAMFNDDHRIQVQTSVRFASSVFDFVFMPNPDHEEQVFQTGQSRPIGFVGEVWDWSDDVISL